MEYYDSLEDAIFYAVQATRELGANKTEYVTLVYQTPDGKYHYAAPKGGEKRSSAKAKLSYPKGAKIVALVHNHPGADDGRELYGQDKFSPADIQQAKALNVPSYMSYGKDMAIRSYTPGKDSARLLQGVPFNHIPEVKPAGTLLGTPILSASTK